MFFLSQARKSLGYEPRVSIEDAVALTVKASGYVFRCHRKSDMFSVSGGKRKGL
jgi:hypothetical protein